jgi:hypothetical protein
MPITNYIAGGFTEGQIQAMIQTELATNPPGVQIPSYSSEPSGYSNGQMYRNSSDGKVYMMDAGVFKQLDMQEGVTMQDLSGNIIKLD